MGAVTQVGSISNVLYTTNRTKTFAIGSGAVAGDLFVVRYHAMGANTLTAEDIAMLVDVEESAGSGTFILRTLLYSRVLTAADITQATVRIQWPSSVFKHSGGSAKTYRNTRATTAEPGSWLESHEFDAQSSNLVATGPTITNLSATALLERSYICRLSTSASGTYSTSSTIEFDDENSSLGGGVTSEALTTAGSNAAETYTSGNFTDYALGLSYLVVPPTEGRAKTGLVLGGLSAATSDRDGRSKTELALGVRNTYSKTERSNRAILAIGALATYTAQHSTTAKIGLQIGVRKASPGHPLHATPKIEIAFGIAPGVDPDPSDWIDVTTSFWEKAGPIITTRGSRHSTNQADAGQIQLALDNREREFEPDYSGSSHFPFVRKMAQIRITATYKTIVYGIWRGYVQTFKPQWPKTGTAAFTIVLGADMIDRLALLDVTLSTVDELTADSPVGWWQLDEIAGSTATDSGSGGNDGTIAGSVVVGDLALQPGSTRLAAQFNPATWLTVSTGVDVGNVAALVLTGNLTLLATIKTASVDTDVAHATYGHNVIECADRSSPSIITYHLGFWPNGELQYRHEGAILVLSDPTVDPDLSDGETHRIAITRDISTRTIRAWIDGAETSLSGLIYAVDALPSSVATNELGICERVHDGASGMAFDGHAQDIAIINNVLSDGRIVAIQSGTLDALPAETTSERITRVADAVEIPAALRDFEVGETDLQSSALGDSALSIMQNAAKTELGLLAVDRNGKLIFHARSHRSKQSSEATFGDEGTELRFVAIEPNDSNELLRNEATGQRTGGQEQRSIMPESIAIYDARLLAVGTITPLTDADVVNVLDALVGRFADPVFVAYKLVIRPSIDPGRLWPVVLDLELGDRIQVRYQPVGPAGRLDLEMFVEQVRHEITFRSWQTVVTLTPAKHSFFSLDTSRLGEATQLGY